ncbi:Atu4866 domain-containing protein [Micromonospora fluostatini]|uniref:Atu4866 domain-containing protein n=1 Tax=Micromonospora sp. JCM 30529 TaxID=3421643 RepID=UPI003D17A6AB
MRHLARIVLGGACVAVLLAACTVGPDTAGRTGTDDAAQPSPPESTPPGAVAPQTPPSPSADVGPHPYVGMWVTADGHIRQMLLANGRYDEARGARQSAYTGSYEILGDRIEYVDDTGFSADGTFDEDVLHHGGFVFYREGSGAHRRAGEERR